MTSHPERLEVTPVDPRIFEWIVSGDEFVDRTCVQCGLHAALFVSAGRFVSLCPSCVARRIESLRTRTGPGEPAWITVLYREACKEAAFQAWKREGLYHVVFDDIWKCGRCGALIQPQEAHYHNEPCAAESPPYCEACADALRGGAEEDA